MNPSINKNLSIIGVPLDMGASTRGARLGPEAIRLAGIIDRLAAIGYRVTDRGNIDCKNDYEMKKADSKLKNLQEVTDANKKLYEKVKEVNEMGDFPLILGGDHSLSMGSIFAMLEAYQDLGVIWFDAHGDINTDAISPSGNIHGMPVATLMGYGAEVLKAIGSGKTFLKRENIVYIGCRDLDAGERQMLKDLKIKVYTMHEMDSFGIKAVMEEALSYLKTDHIHVSFDMDVLDPMFAPGTGTKVPGGMTYREANLALELINRTNRLVSADMVEVNPILDGENQTAKSSVILAGSLLGEWLI